MSDDQNFIKDLEVALSAKSMQLNEKILPNILLNYQLLHTCVKNLYGMLIQRSLIKADPYKLENKISDIVPPDDSTFIENERAIVMGARLSDYESTLDFICTYYKFSTESVTLQKIKKLVEFNNSIDWRGFSINHANINTRNLAILLNEARSHAPQMVLSLISDSISKSNAAIVEIVTGLKQLSDFQREQYKFDIRKKILLNSAFKKENMSSAIEELAEIRRLFPQLIGKRPFYGDLVQEIIKEDSGQDKDVLRIHTLQKLQLTQEHQQKTKQKINTKAILLETVLAISALSLQYEQVITKINTNHSILAAKNNNLFAKFRRLVCKALNLKEPPEEYELIIVNKKTETRSIQRIDYNAFFAMVQHKMQFLQSFNGTQTNEFQKIVAAEENAILNFVNKQITDNQEIIIQLNALDEYFKSNAPKSERSKIKGMKIELVTMKNSIIKANQKRAEYISIVEEMNQMKKLGITKNDA